MSLERAAGRASLIDVLDRVLDKGIVVDAWARVSAEGIDLRRVSARIEVGEVGGRTADEPVAREVATDEYAAPGRGRSARAE